MRLTEILGVGLKATFWDDVNIYQFNARFYFESDNDPQKLCRLFSTIFLFMLGWGIVSIVVFFLIIREHVAVNYGVPVAPYVLLVCAIPLL